MLLNATQILKSGNLVELKAASNLSFTLPIKQKKMLVLKAFVTILQYLKHSPRKIW